MGVQKKFRITFLVILVFCQSSVEGSTFTVCDIGCDSRTIQGAIDLAEDWDTVKVRAGVYSENVVVKKPLNVNGDGSGKTIVNAGNPNTPIFEISSDWVNLSGFTLQGAGNFSYAISLNGSSFCEIKDNVFKESRNVIDLQSANNNTIYNNNFFNNPNGIALTKSDGNLICDNSFSGEKVGLGVVIFSFSNNIVRRNNITTSSYGVYCFDGGNTVVGNHISGGWQGIYNCEVVVNNTIKNNSRNAIGGGRLIEGNTISESKTGINLDGLKGGVIRRNTIFNCKDGITLYRSSQNTVEENTVFSNEYEGIACYDDCNSNFLSNNTVYDNRVGIYVDSSSFNEIYENHVKANRLYGIGLGAASKNLVSRNDLLENPIGISTFPDSVMSGSLFLNEDNILFENNILSNGVGIEVRYGKRGLIKGNVLYSNEDSGISLKYSDSGELVKNTLNSNGYGISLNSSFNMTIRDNSVVDNGLDIYLVDSSENRIIENTVESIEADETQNTVLNNTFPVSPSPKEKNILTSWIIRGGLVLIAILLIVVGVGYSVKKKSRG